MEQVVPSLKPFMGAKKFVFFLLSFFLFAGTVIAQNPSNGGMIATTGSTNICQGETPGTIVSTAPASGGGAGTIEYMWMYATTLNNNPGGPAYSAIAGSNSEDYSPGVLNSTTWFVRCSRRVGSGNLAFSAESNVVKIDVRALPTADITASSTSGFPGLGVDFSTPFVGGASYVWRINGGFFSSQQEPSFTFNSTGTFTVSLTVTANGCSVTTEETITIGATILGNKTTLADPCNCADPLNFASGGVYYAHDYILINSNPGQTFTISNIATGTGLTGLVDVNLNPIPAGTVIPETDPGRYFIDLYFAADQGGWRATVTNSTNFTSTTGPGTNVSACLCPGSPLPVELKNFQATVADQTVLLTWETASEINNDYFDIERSIDGERFQAIGTQAGVGSTTSTTTYKFSDEKPTAGNIYYRLKQVDFDGSFEYSEVVSVKIASNDVIVNVSPNPVIDRTVVIIGDNVANNTNLELVNSAGQLVKTYQVLGANTSIEIDLADLPSGVYMLSVKNSSREQRSFHKLVKF